MVQNLAGAVLDSFPVKQAAVTRVTDDLVEALVLSQDILDPTSGHELIKQLAQRQLESLRHKLGNDQIRSIDNRKGGAMRPIGHECFSRHNTYSRCLEPATIHATMRPGD